MVDDERNWPGKSEFSKKSKLSFVVCFRSEARLFFESHDDFLYNIFSFLIFY
jgi:hypothetical protein